jgi:hypothetical protein
MSKQRLETVSEERHAAIVSRVDKFLKDEIAMGSVPDLIHSIIVEQLIPLYVAHNPPGHNDEQFKAAKETEVGQHFTSANHAASHLAVSSILSNIAARHFDPTVVDYMLERITIPAIYRHQMMKTVLRMVNPGADIR